MASLLAAAKSTRTSKRVADQRARVSNSKRYKSASTGASVSAPCSPEPYIEDTDDELIEQTDFDKMCRDHRAATVASVAAATVAAATTAAAEATFAAGFQSGTASTAVAADAAFSAGFQFGSAAAIKALPAALEGMLARVRSTEKTRVLRYDACEIEEEVAFRHGDRAAIAALPDYFAELIAKVHADSAQAITAAVADHKRGVAPPVSDTQPPAVVSAAIQDAIAAAAQSAARATETAKAAGEARNARAKIALDYGFTAGATAAKAELRAILSSAATTEELHKLVIPEANQQSPNEAMFMAGVAAVAHFLPSAVRDTLQQIDTTSPTSVAHVLAAFHEDIVVDSALPAESVARRYKDTISFGFAEGRSSIQRAVSTILSSVIVAIRADLLSLSAPARNPVWITGVKIATGHLQCVGGDIPRRVEAGVWRSREAALTAFQDAVAAAPSAPAGTIPGTAAARFPVAPLSVRTARIYSLAAPDMDGQLSDMTISPSEVDSTAPRESVAV